jgi:beta-glucosidase
VVQLYVRDEVSSVTTPVMSLKAFKRVKALQPGQTVTVTFNLDVTKELAVYNRFVGPSLSLRCCAPFSRQHSSSSSSPPHHHRLPPHRKYEWVVEPGQFTLMVGPSSNDIRLSGEFAVFL